MIVINCIGAGRWGPKLIRVFATHPESRVETVCDLLEERLAWARLHLRSCARYSMDPLATVSDEAAHAIIIATPVNTHYTLAKAALESGKHVLVEKPLCRSVAEGEDLVALAQQQGRLLCVGHTFLFSSAVRTIHDLICAGDLGRIHYIYATRTNLGPFRTDVNALWDLAAHDLSILNYWLNADPIAVSAHGESYLNPGIDDVAVASFTYPNRVLAHIRASWMGARKVREITIVGEHKMVVWNDVDPSEPVRIYHKSILADQGRPCSDSCGHLPLQIHTDEATIPHITGPEPLAAECGHFLDCIQGRSMPLNDGHNGLRVVRALAAADRSMREGSGFVPLSPMHPDSEQAAPGRSLGCPTSKSSDQVVAK